MTFGQKQRARAQLVAADFFFSCDLSGGLITFAIGKDVCLKPDCSEATKQAALRFAQLLRDAGKRIDRWTDHSCLVDAERERAEAFKAGNQRQVGENERIINRFDEEIKFYGSKIVGMSDEEKQMPRDVVLSLRPSVELVQALESVLKEAGLPLDLMALYFITMRDFFANGERLVDTVIGVRKDTKELVIMQPGVNESVESLCRAILFDDAISDLWDYELAAICEVPHSPGGRDVCPRAQRYALSSVYYKVFQRLANLLRDSGLPDDMPGAVARAYNDVVESMEDGEYDDIGQVNTDDLNEDHVKEVLSAILMHAGSSVVERAVLLHGVTSYKSLPVNLTFFRYIFGSDSTLFYEASNIWDENEDTYMEVCGRSEGNMDPTEGEQVGRCDFVFDPRLSDPAMPAAAPTGQKRSADPDKDKAHVKHACPE